MLFYFDKSNSQKELYFQLNSLMSINRTNNKINGLYAIFKDDICLYVGQSKNIASRIATHLSGKYKTCDKIFVFENLNDDDLDINEKYLIRKLKPIENILVDFDEKVNINKLFDLFHDYEKKAYYNIFEYCDFIMINDKENLMLSTYEINSYAKKAEDLLKNKGKTNE